MSAAPLSCVATIILPTTGDRGDLLRYSAGSALRQTVRDIELFIIGDGVSDRARATIRDLAEGDGRVRFFDHPKHARRGEPYRHVALGEARGGIVCYLTDRDLMMPNHVAVMSGLLRDADLGHTLRFGIEPDGSLLFNYAIDINDADDRRASLHGAVQVIPLSLGGHTLAAYRRLPYGWRTTPAGLYTDTYMWQQFLADPGCRTATSTVPTILYFKRGDHPGLPVAERVAELETWYARLDEPGWLEDFSETVRDAAIRDRARLARFARGERSLHAALGRRFPRAAAAVRRFPGLMRVLKRPLG
jgi:hypothetical protein